MRKLKRIAIVILVIAVIFAGYVIIVNRNSKQMTIRQKILKAVYPAWMWWGKMRGKNSTGLTNTNKQPKVSFYTLKTVLNNGGEFDFNSLRGKKVLLVNTASNCGYTDQYEDLQKLYEEKNGKLMVLAFPANDFKEQEKGNDEEIASFCKLNYGVTFPLMKKSTVIKGPEQNPVFKWLTDANLNGWNNKQPGWNFSKFIVNEEGVLTHYFGATVAPRSDVVMKAIDE